jgi:hypothetical protein
VEAEGYAEMIDYKVSNQDSILQLPLSFPITSATKFRNQQVIIEVKVPVGKEVYIDKRADQLSWYSVRSGSRGLNINIDHDYDEDSWRPGVWYIMKSDGIERKNKEELSEDERLDKMMKKFEKKIEDNGIDIEEIDIKVKDGDTVINVNTTARVPMNEEVEKEETTTSPERKSRRLLFWAINLLKVGM